jgi:hypothetical protein
MSDKTRLFQPLFPQSQHAEAWHKHPTIRAFQAKHSSSAPTLAQLIKLGKHSSSPSLKLSNDAKSILVLALSPRCTSQTRHDLDHKLSRSLGLLPHFWWAGNIAFDVTADGAVQVAITTNSKEQLKEMRTCILKS